MNCSVLCVKIPSEVKIPMKKELKDRLRDAMEARGLRSVDIVEKTGIPKDAGFDYQRMVNSRSMM